jgi:NAD(P)-dependent dehydrogenase (short-subunit alcohol dehydrogenase family)
LDYVRNTISQVTIMTSSPVALVTGASSGIGAAAASALAAHGFDVVGTSRDASRVTPVAGVTMVDLDVTSDGSVAGVAERVLADHGHLDVLVNNAGIGAAGAAEESSIGQVQHIFDVNLFGAMRMTNAVLPAMRARGTGRVLNLSSVLGLVPAPYMAAYSAAKHALEGYGESLDHEVREHGIRVISIEPAYTNTGFEANGVVPDQPLPAYEERRAAFQERARAAVAGGDDPSVVARVIVEAATTTKPRLRYTAGSVARRAALLRRFAPHVAFDRQIRRINGLPA